MPRRSTGSPLADAAAATRLAACLPTVRKSFAAALAASVLLLLPGLSCTSPRVKVERVNEPLETATDFPLHTEHWSEPKIFQLRRQEGLDRVAQGARDDLDLFLRLGSWTRAQWPVGDPEPYPPCNGVDILAAIRSGRTGGFCGQYCYLLADALKSMGYFSVRYLELENPGGDSHFALEAWSNQHDRWVVLDPTYNVHYMDSSGRPLNAMDLHEAYLSRRIRDVLPVEGVPPPRDGKRIESLPERGIDFYANLAFSTRSDLAHLQAPLTMTDRERMFVRYDDPRGGNFKHMKFALATRRIADLYPAVAQVDAQIEKIDGETVLVDFSTRGSLPHFLAYQVRLDRGAWRRCGPRVEWAVPAGVHLLEVSAVNAAGVVGPVFGLRATRSS